MKLNTHTKDNHTKLNITRECQDKINYLLSRFPNTEWSGPAWFMIEDDDTVDIDDDAEIETKKTDKKEDDKKVTIIYTKQKKSDNYPVKLPQKMTLLHFVPVNLGSGAETEYNTTGSFETISKMLEDEEMVKMMQECVQGNIHSHHKMGAFFSATDKEALNEHCPPMNSDNIIWPSLIVSSISDSHAFAYSYRDQYNVVHSIETNNIFYDIRIENTWLTEADKIEEEYKSSKKSYSYGNGYKSKSQGMLPFSTQEDCFAYNETEFDYDNSDDVKKAYKEYLKDRDEDEDKIIDLVTQFEKGIMDIEYFEGSLNDLGWELWEAWEITKSNKLEKLLIVNNILSMDEAETKEKEITDKHKKEKNGKQISKK